MLREMSTRIGSRLFFAAAGGTMTTGRSRITIKQDQRQRAKRAQADAAAGCSLIGTRAYASQPSTSAAPNASAYPHHGQTTANLI